ncbi:hypothetical protein BDV40DRAFT_264732 [Aspergillus tamarii]|uniref:Uncharacterized protein n=1 Tax=Aspergillus tamarii TaxID=41984 RepID=A0A5N6UVD0_ASPTM|nr:hypothetical protein BDV40DRAFT_264732 [Aspergillus tamarii]
MFAGAVLYGNAFDRCKLEPTTLPVLRHWAGQRPNASENLGALIEFYYPKVQSHHCANPF